jgi:hypothetical protein
LRSTIKRIEGQFSTGSPRIQKVTIQGLVFNDPLYIDMNKAVALEGGYGCDYASNPGISVINDIIISDGLLTIRSGTVEVR